jgi:hypothetical protein
MVGAYILVFIINGANLADLFRKMLKRQKGRKSSKFLAVRLATGHSFDSVFCFEA